MREQFGTTGLGLDLALLAIGQKSQFDQYKPASAILGEKTASLLPGFRVLNDIGRLIDPNSRSQKTFTEGVVSNLPIWGDEAMLRKWRGSKRTIDIPDEPEKARSIAGSAKTSTTRDVAAEREDILRSLITGVYISRINPAEARKQQLREQRNAAEQDIRDLLAGGQTDQAKTKAREAGFLLPKATLEYYRRKK